MSDYIERSADRAVLGSLSDETLLLKFRNSLISPMYACAVMLALVYHLDMWFMLVHVILDVPRFEQMCEYILNILL